MSAPVELTRGQVWLRRGGRASEPFVVEDIAHGRSPVVKLRSESGGRAFWVSVEGLRRKYRPAPQQQAAPGQARTL